MCITCISSAKPLGGVVGGVGWGRGGSHNPTREMEAHCRVLAVDSRSVNACSFGELWPTPHIQGHGNKQGRKRRPCEGGGGGWFRAPENG